MNRFKPPDDQPVAAVVSLLIRANRLKDLLQKMAGRPGFPRRWFIVGADLDQLGALHEQWGEVIEVTVVGVPDGRLQDPDMIVDILQLEGVDARECLWLTDSNSAAAPFGAIVWDLDKVN